MDKLLAAAAPHRGLHTLHDWGLARVLFPELAALSGCAAGKGRPDVWQHTVDTIELSATRPRLPSAAAVRRRAELRPLRWTLLLHDISKPETLKLDAAGKPSFHGHEILGARRAEALLRRLRTPAAERKRICRLIRWHLRPGHLADAGAPLRGMRRLVREAGDDLDLLCLHAACDAQGSGGPEQHSRWRRLSQVLRELASVRDSLRTIPLDPLLSGREVMGVTGLRPGPEVGRWLRRIADARDEGRISTRSEARAFLRDES